MDLNVERQERELFAAARPTDLNEGAGQLLDLELDASALREGAFALLERMATRGLLGSPRLSEVVVGVQRAANELGRVEQLLDHAIVPGARRSGVAPGFSEEAALAIGIAGTALSFSGTCEEEVGRWLRVLRMRGEAGVLLQSLGLADSPLSKLHSASAETSLPRIGDPVRKVGLSASNIARCRRAGSITTLDLLLAVGAVYGEAFDRALAANGTSRSEVLELIAAPHRPS